MQSFVHIRERIGFRFLNSFGLRDCFRNRFLVLLLHLPQHFYGVDVELGVNNRVMFSTQTNQIGVPIVFAERKVVTASGAVRSAADYVSDLARDDRGFPIRRRFDEGSLASGEGALVARSYQQNLFFS